MTSGRPWSMPVSTLRPARRIPCFAPSLTIEKPSSRSSAMIRSSSPLSQETSRVPLNGSALRVGISCWLSILTLNPSRFSDR